MSVEIKNNLKQFFVLLLTCVYNTSEPTIHFILGKTFYFANNVTVYVKYVVENSNNENI